MATEMHNGAFRHDNAGIPESNGVLPLFSLKGRTAIVSGAGAGIGLAVAQAFAEAGANVAIWYNTNRQAVAEAEAIEKKYGVKCIAKQVDVVSPESVENAVNDAVKELNGRLDVFVANAGVVAEGGPFIDCPAETAKRILAVNVEGVMWCAKAAGAHFQRQKREGTTIDGKQLEGFVAGSFIATASMSGSIVNIPQLQATYNCSKAAVIHFCRTMAIEWAGFARSNTVSPGYTKTRLTDFADASLKDLWRDKTPMGREGEVSELKGAYLYLASDAASYTTGVDLNVDGGYCVP